MMRILLIMMVPFMCLGQITPREGDPINNGMNESGSMEIKRKSPFNLEEIKVRWKKAALENCTGVPCVVTPPAPPPAPSFTCGTSTITDVDGNAYNTVLIGTQCWTKENLKVTKYNDGTSIGDSTNSTWGTAAIGARTEYVAAGVTGYVGTFGYLYNWYAVNDPRKLCPAGWHVPTDAEWITLTDYLNWVVPLGNVGGKMKSTSSLWNAPNTGATNSSGFSALPGGYRSSDGSFGRIRNDAFVWSATVHDYYLNDAYNRNLYFNNGIVYRNYSNKQNGFSVRCLRD
ncbi:MAG: fibrobacter succinogenes major paralogous domain-containing protein [Bacteroidota bacterium]